MGKRIFVICPVRVATEEENRFLDDYVVAMERQGNEVHLPKRDTNQADPHGYSICAENCDAIRWAQEVHVYYRRESEGSKFDLGMAFMAGKPIKLLNPDDVEPTPHKSLENVLLRLHDLYRRLNGRP